MPHWLKSKRALRKFVFGYLSVGIWGYSEMKDEVIGFLLLLKECFVFVNWILLHSSSYPAACDPPASAWQRTWIIGIYYHTRAKEWAATGALSWKPIIWGAMTTQENYLWLTDPGVLRPLLPVHLSVEEYLDFSVFLNNSVSVWFSVGYRLHSSSHFYPRAHWRAWCFWA